MIDVARIDFWAASGSSLFHRASVLSKLILVVLVVTASVLSRSFHALAAGYALLMAVSAAAGLPFFRMAALSLYAAVFAGLYGLSLRGAGLPEYGLLIFKAVTPAFSVLILISTTTYPRLFSFIGNLLPGLLSSGLFMTYRTLFILLDLMHHLTIALRLRAGLSRAGELRTISALPRALAMLLVKTVESSSRMYAVMTVRSYSGSMAEAERLRLTRHDWLPVGAGLAVLGLVISWRQ